MHDKLWHLLVHAGAHLASHLGRHLSSGSHSAPACKCCGGTPKVNMGCCKAPVCSSCLTTMVSHLHGSTYRVSCSCCGDRRVVQVD